MAIRKAVITAAARGVRLYPVADTVQKSMLPITDRDGIAKPIIQIIIEEALESGVEEVCIVCAPGDEERYKNQLSQLRDNLLEGYGSAAWAKKQAASLEDILRRLSFAVQEESLGYGHAVACAQEFVGEESFLLLLGDYVYISNDANQRCAHQLIDLAEKENCAVAAVNLTREHLVHHYGTLSGKRVPEQAGIYEIEQILEKPSLSRAELELQTPGLRVGHYLCFFGMHVLPHRIFDYLAPMLKTAQVTGEPCPLTPALQELANRESYLAAELHGTRHDVGAPLGLLNAQIALGLASKNRDAMLEGIVELMATTIRTPEGQ